MGNLDEVMKKLKSRQTVTDDLDEVEKTPVKEEKEEKEEVVEEVDDDLENDEEDIDLNDEEEKKEEEKPVEVKKTPQKPSNAELHEQKVKEIAILQDAGVFRSELLIQLAKVNENLYALNYLIDKAIGEKA